MSDLTKTVAQDGKQGLVAGAVGVGVGLLTHSICCGAVPVLLAGVAQTGAAMGAHAHDGMSMGATFVLGALTTMATATGLTYWQQRHTETDTECAHTCLPHKAEQKKSGASWSKVWAKNAAIGAVSFAAMQGIMKITDFNREKKMILAGRDTDRVLVVQESQAVWGLVATHRHYQSNHDLMTVSTDETGAARVPLQSITEEFGDALYETLQWNDVTETAAMDSARMFGGASQNVLKLKR